MCTHLCSTTFLLNIMSDMCENWINVHEVIFFIPIFKGLIISPKSHVMYTVSYTAGQLCIRHI